MSPIMNSTTPLRGIVPPLVTPLDAHQHIDVAALERLLEHVVSGGVHGVFVLGTTGEAVSLDDDVRRELVRRTCKLMAGRVPVLVGITDTCVAESIRLARDAADAGASAVVVSAPFYMPLEQAEVIEYVESIARRQPLPIFLYNIPALSKTQYDAGTVVRLAELPKVIGIKDSSGDASYLPALRQRVARDDWSFFVGTEALLSDAVIAGMHGGVPGGANLDPALFASLYDASVRRDRTQIAELQLRLTLLDRIYRTSTGAASIVRGLKCAMECLGICDRRMGEPLRSATDEECKVIEQYVHDLALQRVGPPVRQRLRSRPRVSARTPARIQIPSHDLAPNPLPLRSAP